jgi:multiple sugar transport system permease protein
MTTNIDVRKINIAANIDIRKINTAYFFLLPYGVLFTFFIVLPVLVAVGLSFTNFNAIQMPQFVGFANYINILTRDDVFMQMILPNTILFAIVTGPIGYMLAFFLAWSLAQISPIPRTVLTLVLYSPSMTSGVAMSVLWRIMFSGDSHGWINSLLMNMEITTAPIDFLQSAAWIMPVMVLVTLWSSMGVGFLAMLAGVLNVDETLYEAATVDGIQNRLQEIFYITIPVMKPQMLFGAVMAIIGSFQAGGIGVALTGANPTPHYAGSLMVNHIDDFGFIRFEMGYAAAGSVLLLLLIYSLSRVARKLFTEKD